MVRLFLMYPKVYHDFQTGMNVYNVQRCLIQFLMIREFLSARIAEKDTSCDITDLIIQSLLLMDPISCFETLLGRTNLEVIL